MGVYLKGFVRPERCISGKDIGLSNYVEYKQHELFIYLIRQDAYSLSDLEIRLDLDKAAIPNNWS